MDNPQKYCNQPAPVVPDSDIPAGYTYLGQFIAHETTFDSRQDVPIVETNPENLRSPAIDLDSVYGPDPRDEDSKKFYEAQNPARLKLDLTLLDGGMQFQNDLPRDEKTKQALIGDPRNDENLAVAQTHVAFIKFHNKVVDTLESEGHATGDLFDATMNAIQDHLSRERTTSSSVLVSRWQELCRLRLPVMGKDSIWRYSRERLPSDPEQGWKLHLSATILTAGRVLLTVSPLLGDLGVLYKGPASLLELDKLNRGIFYGYSQIGKFLTIYPQTTEEAVVLARKLYGLTRRMEAPSIPFDSKYRSDGCVYYRYGAFRAFDIADHSGERSKTIRDPKGNFVADVRDSPFKPDWVTDPFTEPHATAAPETATPLHTTFRIFRALAQRGKGGVYQAVDLSVTPPRLCVLKQGRKNGEVNWDGRDGFWRIKHERRVLAILRKNGVNVPSVYSSFKVGQNYYLAVEFIEGEDLGTWLSRRQRRMSVTAALKRGAELARIVSFIHAAGWVWRGCKPGNVVITRTGELRPLDFEGACPVDDPDPLPWGTTSCVSPETNSTFQGQSRLPEDLYALGAVIHLLLAGRTPDNSPSLSNLRRKIPGGACELVAELLHADPTRRPEARSVALRLEELYLEISQVTQGDRFARRASSANLGSARRSS